jgi:hypothetical protein
MFVGHLDGIRDIFEYYSKRSVFEGQIFWGGLSGRLLLPEVKRVAIMAVMLGFERYSSMT